jgi:hypothetical protein
MIELGVALPRGCFLQAACTGRLLHLYDPSEPDTASARDALALIDGVARICFN